MVAVLLTGLLLILWGGYFVVEEALAWFIPLSSTTKASGTK